MRFLWSVLSFVVKSTVVWEIENANFYKYNTLRDDFSKKIIIISGLSKILILDINYNTYGQQVYTFLVITIIFL